MDAITKSLAEEVAKDAQAVMTAYGLKRKAQVSLKKHGCEESGELNNFEDLESKDDKSSLVENLEEDDEDIIEL